LKRLKEKKGKSGHQNGYQRRKRGARDKGEKVEDVTVGSENKSYKIKGPDGERKKKIGGARLKCRRRDL